MTASCRIDSNGAWLRLYVDMPDNLKLRRLPESAQMLYVWYLCLWKRGDIIAVTGDADLAWMLRLPVDRVTADMEVLRGANLILEDGMPKGWTERQFVSDDVSARVRAWRGKRRNVASNVASNVSSNATSTLPVTPLQRFARATESDTEYQPTRACAGARGVPLPAPDPPDRPTDRPTDQPTVIPPASEPPAEQPRAWSVDDYVSVALRNGANEREARKFAALNDAGRFSPDVAWRGWAAMRTPTEAAGGASGVARARGRAKAGDAVAGAKLASLRRLLEPGAPTLNFSRWLADAVSDVPAGARDRFVAEARRAYQAVKPTEVQA